MSEELKQATFDPSGALARNGIITFPIGTHDEIVAAGHDPAMTGCCAPRANGVMGCYKWGRCIFTREGAGEYRGKGSTKFRGKGPKMIGYRLQTARSEGGRRVENQMSCYGFNQTMVDRMRAGRAAAEEGQDHERIRIVAIEGVEGDRIVTRSIVPVNKAGSQLGTDIREKVEPPQLVRIEPYPRPGDSTGASYDQMLRRRDAEHTAAIEAGWGPAQTRDEEIEELLGPEPPMEPDPEDVPPIEGDVVAEDIKAAEAKVAELAGLVRTPPTPLARPVGRGTKRNE